MSELLPAILSDDQRRAVWLAQYRLANSRLRDPEPDSACVVLAEERVASAGQRESDLAAWAALRETLLPGVAAEDSALPTERDEAEKIALANEDAGRAAMAGAAILVAERDAASARVKRLEVALRLAARRLDAGVRQLAEHGDEWAKDARAALSNTAPAGGEGGA